MNRKPDGRSQLNRLSKDRQAAVADYAALVRNLRAAKPAWTPDEVRQAAQAFFEALALDRQETRLWALTQRLDLRRAQLELTTAKHKESRRSKLRMGLDAVAEAFRHHPEAHKLYEQAVKLIGAGDPPEEPPKTTNPR